MTNMEIINHAESIIHDPERDGVLSREDIGTVSAALLIARTLEHLRFNAKSAPSATKEQTTL